MYGRRCGSVSWRKIPNGVAPSTFAASRTSDGWLCRPASMISIMNGVHCQTSTIDDRQRRVARDELDRRRSPSRSITQLTTP